MIGSPTVMLTDLPKAASFSGINPWSWYMATTASYLPCAACPMSVSAGNGPTAGNPSASARSMPGLIAVRSSVPKSPPSPACGFRAAAAQGPLDRLFHIDGLGRAGLPGHLPRQKPTERLRERVEHRNDPVRRLEP